MMEVMFGSGTFKTAWDYNSADMVKWMKYPLNNQGGIGEQVGYSYLNQVALDKVYTMTNGTASYYFVQLSRMDEAGRIKERFLGATSRMLIMQYGANSQKSPGFFQKMS
jgi:hypothetical protein